MRLTQENKEGTIMKATTALGIDSQGRDPFKGIASDLTEQERAAVAAELAAAAPIWEPLQLCGRCCNGAERDSGTLYHGVPRDSDRAACGVVPGRSSAGWSQYRGSEVTCPRCIRSIRAKERKLSRRTEALEEREA